MTGGERWAEACRWLRYAQEDLDTAESLMRESHIPRQICWLAQQCAEKSLKAVLVFLQVDFPRRHDLDVLRSLIPEGWSVRAGNLDLAELTEWAVESRYPGNWPEATESDANCAVALAKAIFVSVSQDLRDRGYSLDS